jgi:hypothetical protein
MQAYDDVIGKIRNFAKEMDGTQEGDPRKAAAAIDKALQAEIILLRLQLGHGLFKLLKISQKND